NILAQVSRRAPRLSPPEAAPATTDPGSYYDLQLFGRLASDPEFVSKLLEIFITTVPGQVQALQEATDHRQWDAIVREAHHLKTTFGNFNIQSEAARLRQLEQMAERRASRSEFQPLINALLAATRQFCAIFQQRLDMMPQVQ
ncbi:Hpt domain-containing protein, partial [Salmonella enterica]|nr:Hpt domain-containing protein [Salmonella enterica]